LQNSIAMFYSSSWTGGSISCADGTDREARREIYNKLSVQIDR
jgi:hypothetical protein